MAGTAPLSASAASSQPSGLDGRPPTAERTVTAATCPNPSQPSLDYLCPLGPTYLIPGLIDLNGWKDPSHYTNILTGDLDGDGRDELVARGVAGTQVYRFDTVAGQWSQISSSPILPDADGWDQPQYYSTIRLGDIDGDRRAELVARSSQGIIVFSYVPGDTPDAASWTQLTTSGPMPDANGWGVDPSNYSTVQLVRLGRLGPTMQLMARSNDGLILWRWNGIGWDQLPTLTDFSNANGWNKPEYYTTIHAWNDLVLFARGPNGLRTYAFGDTPGQWTTYGTTGPFKDTDCFANGKCWNDEAYYSSVLPVNGYGGFGDNNDPVVMGRGATGVTLYVGAPGQGGVWEWDVAPSELPSGARPLTDADGFSNPESYRTIQLADVNGDNKPELLGRTSTGMVVYRFDRDQHWVGPMATGTPALADDPWKDPAYYSTISTADLGPSSVLIARGPHGLRTWRFDSGASTWTRYRPYGNFPAVDAGALAAMTTFLGLATGTIRDTYTTPTGSPTSDQLSGYQSSLASRCMDLQSANPPTYAACTPPGGSTVTPTTWTAASNQIIAELFWARQVIDHHTTLNEIQTALFLDQDSEFPAIAADLKLAQASTVAAEKTDYAELFASVFELLSLLPVPGLDKVLEVTSGALSLASAATPSLNGSEPTEFDHTFAQMQNKIATIRQETQDALIAHRHHVLGDYGLLQTVGHLVASQVWQLDTGAALSVGRQQFTLWVYQGMLPVLWDRWTVNACDGSLGIDTTCHPPANGAGMNTYTSGGNGVSFDGLVPHQTPCHNAFNFICTWTPLADQGYGDTWTALTGDVTTPCKYDPTAGGSWRYGSCSLGIPKQALFKSPAAAPWEFKAYACTVMNSIDVVQCVRAQPTSVVTGNASGVGTTNGRVQMVLEQEIDEPLDLRGARIRLNRLLHEQGGTRELVGHPSGHDLLPYRDTVEGSATRRSAPFGTPAGARVRVRGLLSVQDGLLRMELTLNGAALDAPERCGDGPQRTHLGLHMFLRDADGQRVQVLDLTYWQCGVDREGGEVLSYPPQTRRVAVP